MTHQGKNQFVAAALAVLVTLCAGWLLRGKLGTSASVPAMKPPSLGVVLADSKKAPPDVLARAGRTHQDASAPQPPAERPDEARRPNSEPPAPHTAATTDAPQQRTPQADARDARAEIAESRASRPPAEETAPKDRPPIHEDAILAAPPPAPTPVEQRPRPISEMSVHDIQKAVAEYERWVHNGRIVLRLDYSRLAPQQLNAIASMYYVSTPYNILQVEPRGAATLVTSDTIPAKALVGDLTGDREKWPPELADVARSRFGPNHRAHANFVVTPACELTLYRVLAQAVGDRQPLPGTEFVLRLEPKGALIDVELLSRIYR